MRAAVLAVVAALAVAAFWPVEKPCCHCGGHGEIYPAVTACSIALPEVVHFECFPEWVENGREVVAPRPVFRFEYASSEF